MHLVCDPMYKIILGVFLLYNYCHFLNTVCEQGYNNYLKQLLRITAVHMQCLSKGNNLLLSIGK